MDYRSIIWIQKAIALWDWDQMDNLDFLFTGVCPKEWLESIYTEQFKNGHKIILFMFKNIFSSEISAQLAGNSCFREVFLTHIFQLGWAKSWEDKVTPLRLTDFARMAYERRVRREIMLIYLSIPELKLAENKESIKTFKYETHQL